MSDTRELCDLADVEIPAEPAVIPEGESVPEKLRILATWLLEDSDLPDDEATDFVAALNHAIERLDAQESVGEGLA